MEWSKRQKELSREVGAKEKRKLRAKRKGRGSALQGLKMFGLVGWSVVVPTLAGTALGHWLDSNHPGKTSWTLNLLIIGLIVGCLNAWHWVKKENKDIHQDLEEHDE